MNILTDKALCAFDCWINGKPTHLNTLQGEKK